MLKEAKDGLDLRLYPSIWDGAVSFSAEQCLVLDEPADDMDGLVGWGARDAVLPQVRVQ